MFVPKTGGKGRSSAIRTHLSLVDFRKGENVLAYVRNMNQYSHTQLFATADATACGGTSAVAPTLKMAMSVPVPTGSSVAEPEEAPQKKVKKRSPTEALEVVVLGLSHHNAKVEVREKLAIPEHLWNDAAAKLCEYDSIAECSVLSTCNRFELYLAGKNQYECMRDAIDYLYKRAEGSLDLSTLRRSLFLLSGEDAIWHLMRVSAGLDSLIVGEGQILAQVKRAYERGVEPTGQGGRVVSRLLNTAVTAGKRVRTETGISRGAVSVSSAAAEFTCSRLHLDCGIEDLSTARVTIIGAGKMARLLLIHLQTLGVSAVTVVNLTLESIAELAAEFPDMSIQGKLMADLYPTIAVSDVVFPCTASQTTIIDHIPLAEALQQRDSYAAAGDTNNVMFVDISVPRNVHADCSNVAGAVCYNVDHLKSVVQRNTSKRKREMLDAEQILKEEQGGSRVTCIRILCFLIYASLGGPLLVSPRIFTYL
jgi:glutamyl-tRNA reductase